MLFGQILTFLHFFATLDFQAVRLDIFQPQTFEMSFLKNF